MILLTFLTISSEIPQILLFLNNKLVFSVVKEDLTNTRTFSLCSLNEGF